MFGLSRRERFEKKARLHISPLSMAGYTPSPNLTGWGIKLRLSNRVILDNLCLVPSNYQLYASQCEPIFREYL